MTAPTQDFILLNNVQSPGVAKVRGAGSPRNWDMQQGYGLSGAVLYYVGTPLAKFEVDIMVWLPAHFEQWRAFAKATLALPAPKRIQTSMSIQHPELNDYPIEIFQCVVEDVGKWEQDDTGLWMRTIKFWAFRAPKPVLVKPDEGPPPVNNDDPPDPAAAGIRARQAETKRLGDILAAGSVPR